MKEFEKERVRKNIFILIILIIITGIITYNFNGFINSYILRNVIYDREDYEYMVEEQKNYKELDELSNSVKDNHIFNINNMDLLDGQVRGIIKYYNDDNLIYYNTGEGELIRSQAYGNSLGSALNLNIDKDGYIVLDNSNLEYGLNKNDRILTINNRKIDKDNIWEYRENLSNFNYKEIEYDILNNNKIKNLVLKKESKDLENIIIKDIDEENIYIRFKNINIGIGEKLNDYLEENSLEDKGIIMDFRNNQDRLLNIDMVKEELEFLLSNISEGDIGYLKDKNDNIIDLELKNNNKIKNTKNIVMLIDEDTSNLSKIIIKNIKENHNAKLIGVKNSQELYINDLKILSNRSMITIPMYKYYFNDNNLSSDELILDKEIIMDKNIDIGLEYMEDIQLDKAIQMIKR